MNYNMNSMDKKQKEIVSVIIPTYNRAHLLNRAIDSALAQCREGDEIIVIDDGSKDGSAELVRKYGDPVQLIVSENSGAGAARNKGVARAKCDLIAFLDSDDTWMDGKIALERRLLEERPDILYCFSDFATTDRQGKEYRNYIVEWHHDERSWDEILSPGVLYSSIAELPDSIRDFHVHTGDLYRDNARFLYMFTSTVMARRIQSGDALRFAENTPTFEDWVAFGKLSGAGIGAYLDIETAWQFGDADSRLTGANAFICATTRLEVLRQVWKADKLFMAEHSDLIEEIEKAQRLPRAIGFIAQRKPKLARIEIDLADQIPVIIRFLAILPGWLGASLLTILRLIKQLLSGKS